MLCNTGPMRYIQTLVVLLNMVKVNAFTSFNFNPALRGCFDFLLF
jgi:hypothetical protein